MEIGVKVIAPARIFLGYREAITNKETFIFTTQGLDKSSLPEKVKEIARDFFADLNEYNISLYNQLTK